MHLTLSVATLVLLWLHIRIRKSLAMVCLTLATSIWILHSVLRIALLARRNWGRRGGPGTHTLQLSDKLGSSTTSLVTIALRKSMEVRAGQYIYLTVPALAARNGLLQSHPYFVISADGQNIQMIIESRQGFSRELRSLQNYNVWIDGPYGSLLIDDFEKVVFFASGIGISAHILAIRSLLQQQQARRAVVRRIVLAWVLETVGE